MTVSWVEGKGEMNGRVVPIIIPSIKVCRSFEWSFPREMPLFGKCKLKTWKLDSIKEKLCF